MTLLTVATGILLSLTGAFCFIFSGYSFSSIAFVVGFAMSIAGVLEALVWVASGRGGRLPDTLLVEGIVMLLFGFAVLNDQVPDALISVFFGALTAISGATRVSLSLAVSLIRPRDWAKVMAFAVLVCLLGVTMMMPTLIAGASHMILVGASFIINGLSLLVYAMYMDRRGSGRRGEEAQARRAAKLAAAEEKRRERDYLRSLSRKERSAAIAEKKRLRREAEEARREQRRREREERAEAGMAPLEETISLSDSEVQIIREKAEELGFTDGEPAEDGISASQDAAETDSAVAGDSSAAGGAETVTDAAADRAVNAGDSAASAELPFAKESSVWPEFKKPENIPRFRERQAAEARVSAAIRQPEPGAAEDPAARRAVSLDEIESAPADLGLAEVELPQPERRAEGGEAWKRLDILRDIDSVKGKKEEYRPFTGLREGELAGRPRKRLSEAEGTEEPRLSFDPLAGIAAEHVPAPDGEPETERTEGSSDSEV